LDKGCVLCEKESLQEFQYWRIIENMFPYDKVAKAHNMILPKRHIVETELSAEEVKELRDIKEKHLQKEYDFMIEAMPKMKSIPQHFHIHLIEVKD
jgi:hypothetical protein